jgi:cytochrome b6-f complex iron-sulfur subunit
MSPDRAGAGLGRRTVLGVGWAAFAATIGGMLGATVRFLVPNVLFEPPTAFKIGRPDDYALGSVTLVPDWKIFIIRDAEGRFQVLTATCPHLRCIVRWVADDLQYECPCHGSRFTERGRIVAGPSPGPLEWYEVTLATDGHLYVNTLAQVPADYRLTL